MPEAYYKKLLEQNRAWAEHRIGHEPEYFDRHAEGQSPPVLWIGCSDSRVPANEITGTRGGEIFVHRNIANLVIHQDLNMLSVVSYAVEVLKVDHVIVCGHYGCGGVAAAMTKKSFGLLDKWLRNIKEVHHTHHHELDQLSEGKERTDRLVELNVIRQVNNLAKTAIIQKAWKDRKGPILHGWVYGLDSGVIKDLFRRDNLEGLDHVFEYDFDE